MSSDIALSVQDLSKSYRIAHRADAPTTAAEALVRRIRHPLLRQERETFWALRDVSLEVRQGEVLGVMGRNGAGKSTFLKALSRVIGITKGRIDLYGRVGCLLEVGMGFHPELTGRENIYFNGSILGMRRREIDRQFDAIVDFSGVEQFLDTQVKRYSSGMYVRLAFAVAAHLSTEILLVDEVLAVGDRQFQDRCLGKLSSVAEDGRTVLFVSHQMESVAALCSHAVLFEHGQIAAHGEVDEVVARYVAMRESDTDLRHGIEHRLGSGELRFVDASLSETYYGSDEEKIIDFEIERRRPYEGLSYVTCAVLDARESTIVQCDSRLVHYELLPADHISGRLRLRTPWLKPGRYRVDLSIHSLPHGQLLDETQGALWLEILPRLPYPGTTGHDVAAGGSVFADFSYESRDDAVPFGSHVQRAVGQPLGGGG
jgi:lipopolysaccharide transport system ATP-binding protein